MEFALYIIITLFILTLGVSIFVIRNLMIKVEKQEDIIISQEKILLGYQDYLDKFSRIIEFSNEKLKSLDTNNMFSSDDTIGFFFRNLEEIQKVLNEFSVKKIKE